MLITGIAAALGARATSPDGVLVSCHASPRPARPSLACHAHEKAAAGSQKTPTAARTSWRHDKCRRLTICEKTAAGRTTNPTAAEWMPRADKDRS